MRINCNWCGRQILKGEGKGDRYIVYDSSPINDCFGFICHECGNELDENGMLPEENGMLPEEKLNE